MSDAKATKVLDHAGDYATVSFLSKSARVLHQFSGSRIYHKSGMYLRGRHWHQLPLNQAFMALAISAVIQAAIAYPISDRCKVWP